MSSAPLPKAAKPDWANQLARLPCLVVYVKIQFEPFFDKVRTKCELQLLCG